MNDQLESSLLQNQSAQDYLKLSRVYAAYLSGLRWSGQEDALVDADNQTFAFCEAIAEFIEGFASQGRVVAFGYLLHWMDLLQNHRLLINSTVQSLHANFAHAENNWRFAGAFAATLSGEVPEVPEPPDLGSVGNRLRNRAFPIRWFVSQFHESQYPPALPPIEPATFEAEVIRKLEAYNDIDVRTWLRTGRGPIRHAERLAQEPPMPRSLARVLATLIERPRLCGAQTYVTQLVGALTLPPRRFVPQELPVGGYSDIVTRGQVEQLLPTQFALDELEFLRRYAEKELLYFRREEPPAQNRQELVVLLDQGVRTWGDVRLVLSAAAIAFGKQAIVRKTPFFLATTSNHGRVIEPTGEDEESLGRLIEASDLSLNPGLALEQTLETSSEAMRDVVLLTHPRSLREDDVLNAARRLGPRDRLFAVALDGHGQVEVSEIRRGTPIKVRQFHVDFASSQPKPRRPHTGAAPGTAWTGDVEAIPAPFRLGTEAHITHFDFDYAGQWLLTVSGQGTLHVWKLDGATQEMLPRPCRKIAMKDVIGLLGVTGGFVVIYNHGRHLVVAHYDLVRRHCALFDVGPGNLQRVSRCFYVHEHHSVTLWKPNDGDDDYLVELDTAQVYRVNVDTLSERSHQSCVKGFGHAALEQNRVLPHKDTDTATFASADAGTSCYFALSTGLLMFRGEFSWGSFQPLADGKPCFHQATVRDVQLAGTTLAIRAQRKDIGDSITLVQPPDEQTAFHGTVVREYPVHRLKHKIARHLLSFDGSRIALLRSDHRVEVEPIFDSGLKTIYTRVGGFTMEARFFAGTHCVMLNLGASKQFWHLFKWGQGRLEHRYERISTKDDVPAVASFTDDCQPFVLATVHPKPACCGQDPDRYLMALKRRLWFVLDRFGQVAVLDENEKLLAMFVAFRDRCAAWMPDGTRFGSLMLSLGHATSGAADKIGQTLLRAES